MYIQMNIQATVTLFSEGGDAHAAHLDPPLHAAASGPLFILRTGRLLTHGRGILGATPKSLALYFYHSV